MLSDRRLRIRFLLAALAVLAAWYAWSEADRAEDRLAGLRDQGARASRAEAERSEEAAGRARYQRLATLLEARDAGPTTAAGLRERLLRLAAGWGVEVSATHFQPLPRPPPGTRGAEARITAEGRVPALLGFAGAVETAGWPLQPGQVQLQIPLRPGDPAPPGALTFRFTVLWPDPDHPWPPGAADRLVADPRLDGLEAFLAGLRPPAAAPGAAAAPAGVAAPSPLPPASAPSAMPEPTPGTDHRARPGTPVLQGFVDPGGGAPLRAVLFHEGETILAAVGDRVGAWTVIDLGPAETVLLAHPERAPLRLALR